MCDLCKHSPCLNSCPNKTHTPTLHCEECTRGLYGGDKYIEYDGEIVGSECYRQWSYEEWLDFLKIREKEI